MENNLTQTENNLPQTDTCGNRIRQLGYYLHFSPSNGPNEWKLLSLKQIRMSVWWSPFTLPSTDSVDSHIVSHSWDPFVGLCFNVNTFLKSVSTSKSRVTYDHDTGRVTYDLDTTTHKIIGVVGSPSTPLRLYLPPFRNLIFHCIWKSIPINRLCPDTDSRVFF